MDPNANLRSQLSLAARIQDCGCDDGICQRCEDCAERGAELAELVIALDDWIRKGGFLPAHWTQAEELKCPRCQAVYLSEPGHTGIRLCGKCQGPVDANPNRQGLAKK